MEGPLAIGGLVVVIGFLVWFVVSEAKSGAATKEALKNARGVINATKAFNRGRRESRGLPRAERLKRVLREIREARA